MYDNPKEITYAWNAASFGASTLTKYLQGPKGKRGRVTYINATATTSFVGTSTAAAVQVGVSGTLTQQANMPMGTAASPTQAGSSVVASDKASGLNGFDPTNLPYTYLAADTQVVVTLLAATGGSPAGAADVEIKIEWF